MSNGRVRRWRKVLYLDQGHPDNYTPQSVFLSGRTFNKNLVAYSLFQCLEGGAEVALHISLVIIFWCCYTFIKAKDILPTTLILSLVCVSVAVYVFIIINVNTTFRDIIKAVKTSFLFLITGYSLSPVLYTLTDTISTDSIHSMAASSFLLHLLTADYGVPAPVVSWQISLNAAMLSSVCLASRFDNHVSAFSLLCLSIFCFLLVPLSRDHLLQSSILTNSIISSLCIILLSYISTTTTLLTLITLTTVQFLCPFLFYKLQSDKQTIHGPWDEATPDNL